AANAEHSSLSTQLEQIRGGVCPFLKEKCRQFDPSKVEGDLRQKRATIAYLQTNIESAESALYAAKIDREQLRREDKNLAGKRSRLELMTADLFSAFDRLEWDAIRTAANGLGQWIQNVQPMPDFPRPLRRIESEISKLGAAEYKQRDDAAIYEGRSAELIKSIVSLDQRLEVFV